MVYAYDQWAQMPIRDLYDSLIMLAAINAAKDMYEKGELQLKDFKKEYGDFYSPSNVDMARYNKEFDVSKFVSDLYDRGIDPLRSAEGRALVRQYIASRPYKWYNTAKQTAEVGMLYNKAKAELESKGLYNPEMETKYLKYDISNWDSSKGAWNRMSPSIYKDIDTIAEPIVKNVDYSFDEALTKERNDGNDYYTISKDRLMQAIDDNMSDILSTPQGGYHYWKAMLATNNDKNLAMALLRELFANRLSDNIKEKKEADPWKMAQYKSRLSMQEYANKAAIDHKYHEIEADAAVIRKNTENRDKVKNIFRAAEKNVTKNGKITGAPGVPEGYIPDESYYQYIDPVGSGWGIDIDDKGHVSYRLTKRAFSGNGSIIYTKRQLDALYTTDKGTYNRNNIMRHGSTVNTGSDEDLTFQQNGHIVAKYDPISKHYRYFIGGYMQYKTGEEWKDVSDNNGNTELYMEVKERDDNYGEKNK